MVAPTVGSVDRSVVPCVRSTITIAYTCSRRGHTCRLVGVNRILFGSDYPVLAPERAVADVFALGFEPEEERQIFHDNAAALFQLPSEPRR